MCSPTRLALALLLAFPAAVHAAQEERPPNVVFILADDLGWRDLGCYGNERIRTPHVDALAAEGMRFTDAYAPAPVCSPSRAAILTGKSPARLRITNHVPESPVYAPPDAPLRAALMLDHLPLAEVTFAERLKKAGYATGFVGKWHLSGPWRDFDGRGRLEFAPEHQGFDFNVGGCAFSGPPTFFDPYGIHNLPPRKPGEYLPDRLADEAVAFLRGAKDAPFLLCLWTYEVHWPIEAPAERVREYAGREGPGLKDAVYGAMVTSFDRAVGRVLGEIDALGLAERTLVIVTSDNGGWEDVVDNRPLRGAKGFLYEGGIRVPLVVRWPGVVAPGSVCSTPVIGTDLHPTLLEAAGVVVDESALDGVSLVPLLRGAELSAPHPLFFHYPHYAWHGANRPAGAVREGSHKLIRNYDDGSLELYDVEEDLGEARNLAQEQPELAAELDLLLGAWLTETGARMPKARLR